MRSFLLNFSFLWLLDFFEIVSRVLLKYFEILLIEIKILLVRNYVYSHEVTNVIRYVEKEMKN